MRGYDHNDPLAWPRRDRMRWSNPHLDLRNL
jgi:hypothetical protein